MSMSPAPTTPVHTRRLPRHRVPHPRARRGLKFARRAMVGLAALVALTGTDVSNASPPAVAGYFDGIALLPGGDLLLADSFE